MRKFKPYWLWFVLLVMALMAGYYLLGWANSAKDDGKAVEETAESAIAPILTPEPMEEVLVIKPPQVCEDYDFAYSRDIGEDSRHYVRVRSAKNRHSTSFEIPDELSDARDFVWSPDGRYLAFSVGYAWTESYVMVWDYNTHNIIYAFVWEENVQRPVWSPDGKSLAAIIGRPDEYQAAIVIARFGEFLDIEYEMALVPDLSYDDYLSWTGNMPEIVKEDLRSTIIGQYRTEFSQDRDLFWIYTGKEVTTDSLMLELEGVVDFAWRPVGYNCH